MEDLIVYRLSPQQKRTFLQQKLTILSASQLAIKITGPLNILQLKEAISKAIQDDTTFRTSYIYIDNSEIPVQKIKEDLNFIFIQSETENLNSDWGRVWNEAALQLFDLENGPSIRVDLIYEGLFAMLIITVPPVCADFCGLSILGGLIRTNYIRLSGKGEPGAEEEILPYLQFSEWQNQLLESEEYKEGINYWRTKINTDTTLSLPFDKDPHNLQTVLSQSLSFEFPKSDISILTDVKGSFGSFFGLCWQLLIWQLSGKKTVVTGHMNIGRDFEELYKTQGVLSTCLPISVKLSENRSFKEVLLDYEHTLEVNDEYKVFYEAEESGTTGFQIFPFSFEFSDVQTFFGNQQPEELTGFELVKRSVTAGASKIQLRCVSQGDHIQLIIQYNEKAFDLSGITFIAEAYHEIVKQCSLNPDLLLKDINLMEDRHLKDTLERFNNSTGQFIPPVNVVDLLFEDQVSKYPEAIAVIAGDKKITYSQLYTKVASFANYLNHTIKVKSGDRIAVLCNENEHMIIGILGIIKAGATYVPIDPTNPKERVRFILNDCSAKALITEECFYDQYADELDYVISLDQLNTFEDVLTNSGSKRTPESPLYIIYTSGTTGMPKGVIVPDRALVNYVFWLRSAFSISEKDSSILLSSFAFDLGYTAVWGTLLAGGCLHLVANTLVKDPDSLVVYLLNQRISYLKTTPSLFNIIAHSANVDKLGASNLRLIILGGELIRVRDLEHFIHIKPDIDFANHYGPTETTIGTVATLIDKSNLEAYRVHPVIGKPIVNSFISILDSSGRYVPPGIVGELCVSGSGMSLGYANNEDLSLKCFVAHPYKNGWQMYKTGDQASWMPDGNILFLGRKDDQVKIRGHRVELNEVQQAILQFDGIGKAVVTTVDTDLFGKELAAYFESETPLDSGKLRAFLQTSLPDAFIPSYFIRLDAIPLSLNGKIDKSKLPAPLLNPILSCAHTAPSNDSEQQMANIWKEILGVDKIGVDDNFFDLGGHSLKAIQLASQIHKSFNVKIDLGKIFMHPTVKALCLILEGSKEVQFQKIAPVEVRDFYTSSHAQRRIWVLSQFAGGSVAYNVPSAFVLEGQLNFNAFEHAFRTLIDRHESLRTVFKEDEHGEIWQYIKPLEELQFNVENQDLRGKAHLPDELQAFIQGEFTKPFNLIVGPLLRAGLYMIGDNKWIFVYVLHHIVSDGWSRGVLIKELLLFYKAYLKGENHQLSALSIQYKDYAAWQQQELTGDTLKIHKNYWLNQFSGELPVLELRGINSRPAVKTYNGGTVHLTIHKELSQEIKRLSHDGGGTLYMGLLTLVNILLYHYTGQKDIIIGGPIAGREHVDLEEQIGFYVNTLALRTRFSSQDSFLQLLSKVRETTLDGYKHQIYPLDELVNELELPRDMSRSPLFDIIVVLQNLDPIDKNWSQQLEDLKVSSLDSGDSQSSKFDLAFGFAELDEVLQLSMEYNSDIYSREMAERLVLHLEQLLAAVISSPSAPIYGLNYLSASERDQLLVGFNDTSVSYPVDQTLVSLFEQQVVLNPDAVAVVFEDRSLSYTELNRLSSQLGNCLRNKYGVVPDDLIGICLERSEWLIITILGILKSGAAYVPVDPDYPQERIDYMLSDSNCKVLIDEAWLSLFRSESALYAEESPVRLNQPTDLAYVIYTSGSTGRPKGVMVEHRSVIRLVKSANYIKLTEKSILLSTGAVSFDATTFEYWGMLLNGGQLILCPQSLLLDAPGLSIVMSERGVNLMWFTSGWLNQLIDTEISLFKGLKTVIAGGDKLSPVHIQRLTLAYPELEIINGYGPTENTTFSLTHSIGEVGVNIPIGRPISNSSVYILDGHEQLKGIGIIGEICVGGTGLARGYLNQPVLSSEKFVPNPYRKGERMYKTGDLGRWLSDGNIEYIGRVDDQVKIRGYRIELGEIQAVLEGHEGVESAVVLSRSLGSSEKELVAYLVGSEELNIAVLQTYLGGILPAYMIPGHYVQMEALPLTANGKVDKMSLPDPEGYGMDIGTAYVAPRNETEAQLVEIWQEILGKEQIGVKDNFFELGGHSLKATRLVSQIHRVFDVKIEIKEIFINPTIEILSDIITASKWVEASKSVQKENRNIIEI